MCVHQYRNDIRYDRIVGGVSHAVEEVECYDLVYCQDCLVVVIEASNANNDC